MITCSIAQGRICVRANGVEVERIRQIGSARWDPLHYCWWWPQTPSFWRRVRHALPEVKAAGLLLNTELDARDRARAGRTETSPLYTWKTPPWRHQVGPTHYLMRSDAGMLHCHMGTGKTKIVIDALAHLRAWRTLVICPVSVIPVWTAEVAKHTPWPVLRVLPLTGPIPRRAAYLHVQLDAQTQPIIVVTNYEAVWRSPLDALVLKTDWRAVVFDESHRIKAPGGKASRFCSRIHSPLRIALTGTPMPHSPLDIYAQYRALDPGIFGTSFTSFRAQYAVLGGFNGKIVVAFQNLDDLRHRMDEILCQVPEDVLDLPPLQVIDRTCELEPAARGMYEAMENTFVTQVRQGVVTAANALVKLLRLQQMTSGFVPVDTDYFDGENLEPVSNAKATLFRDIIEDLGPEPVVVFCRFVRDLAVCREALEASHWKGRVGEISGRHKDYAAWQRGEVDALVVQVQAGGLGIDLSRARYGFYYSLGFSLADYDQSLARLHRPGQVGRTVIYRLAAEDTVDQRVLKALAAKRAVIEYVLNDFQGKENQPEPRPLRLFTGRL